MEQIPTISVDRALAHYIQSIQIDTAALSRFYDQLPFKNKRRLSECHIHFSAAFVKDGRRVILGEHIRHRQARNLVPAKTNILVYVGTLLAIKDLAEASRTVGHELAHFADTSEAKEISWEEFHLQRELRLRRNGFFDAMRAVSAIVVTFGVYMVLGVCTPGQFRLSEYLCATTIVVILTWLLGKSRQKTRVATLEHRLQEIYEQDEREKHATQHCHLDYMAVSVIPLESRPPIIAQNHNERSPVAKIKATIHRRLCLYPPGNLWRRP